LRERIADGCTLRRFTDFYCLPVPRHDAFHRGFTRLTPETLKAINDLVVQAAVDLELEDGQKLRVDTTVVQTDIHHPTDNTLLWDVVGVVTRLVGRLAKAMERRRIKGFCDRTRAARRRMLAIQRMTTTQRQHQQRGKYRELIGIAEEVIESAPGPGEDFSFTQPRDPHTFSKQFRKYAVRLGFSDFKFHHLRGTHATLLLDRGVPVHTVAERIGDDPSVLLKNYAKRKRQQTADSSVSAVIGALAAASFSRESRLGPNWVHVLTVFRRFDC
jgi:hypothetical protein